MPHQRPPERAEGAQEEGARGELASSFPARGYGSFAQWHRRRRRMPNGHARLSAESPQELDAWARRHSSRLKQHRPTQTAKEIAQSIADRAAG